MFQFYQLNPHTRNPIYQTSYKQKKNYRIIEYNRTFQSDTIDMIQFTRRLSIIFVHTNGYAQRDKTNNIIESKNKIVKFSFVEFST